MEAEEPSGKERQFRMMDLRRQVALDFWKPLALALLSALATAGVLWFTVGKNTVTRADVLVMLETQSPYARDREFLRSRAEQVDHVNSALSQMRDTQVEMKLLLAMMAQKNGVPVPPNWGHVQEGRR